ncbi:sulfotransferase family 2 domain-containing protein [Halomonas lysinitropha]|uniref:Sulfotransferase family protein n=1 Tax=Halomonas lysinitropha TaxID=2607506 RepID=A0A5K1I303_9GAMM|nr:sulfotransferase family 2 domain-containing protein [Halomonas lysinitropha]VVZ95746.1 Sulfotransferase family protein [Halomonas lysinitropha]
MNPIIFVHIPKTAGTSFRAAAEAWFGKRRLLFDYGSQARKTSRVFRDHEDGRLDWSNVVHKVAKSSFVTGHFPAGRYLKDFDPVCFCTFVRDPIQRVISQYFHHKNKLGYEKSIENFVEDARFHDHQHRLLAGISLNEMGFVGVTERYTDSIALFNQRYGTGLKVETRNQRTRHASETDVPDAVIERIRVNNTRDLELYEKALQLLDEQLSLPSSVSAR